MTDKYLSTVANVCYQFKFETLFWYKHAQLTPAAES